jgi:Bacterial Ig-like domain
MSFRWMTRLRGGDAPRSLFAKSQSRGTKVRRRLVLDALEDRCLLATFTLLPSTIVGTAGQPVSVRFTPPPPTPANTPVAKFNYGSDTTSPNSFSVAIDWGNVDSNFVGYVSQPGGSGTVYYAYAGTALQPGYTYPQAGTYTVAVTVSALDGSGATATVNSTANIADTQITNAFVTQNPLLVQQTQGVAFTSTSGTVATFSNGNTLSTPSDFIVTIDWGDGLQNRTQGQVNLVTPGNFSVTTLTPHTYTTAGTFPISVQIVSLGGSRATADTFSGGRTATVQVNGPSLTPVATPAITGVAGQSFTGLVGAFTQFAGAPPSAFDATIDWGDGSTSTGVITSDPTVTGQFDVSGTHTYANFGAYSIMVTVNLTGTTTTGTLTNTATIADVPLSGTAIPISAVAGVAFNGPVASFSSPNTLALASEFLATIDWGDGTGTVTAGLVQGSNGNFTVTGQYTYASPAPSLQPIITITHFSSFSALPGSQLILNGSAFVLEQVAGAMSRASDSGPSNTDGITNINTPVFLGTGEPGATIDIVDSPGNAVVGTTTVDSSGNWTAQVSALSDGRYMFFAQVLDSTGAVVQTAALPVTPSGGTTLVVDTAGPTVASVTFLPSKGQLRVVLQDPLAGLYPPDLSVASNFQLAAPTGTSGLSPYAVRSLVVARGGPGQSVVTITYNLGSKLRTGAYVVTINARGIIDWAGNTLVEKRLVAFPQTTNAPNPNYIAEIDVAKNGSTSAPKQYVSLAEQQAASAYARFAQTHKIVRVPPRPLNVVRARVR